MSSPKRFAEMTPMEVVTAWGEMCAESNPQEAWTALRDAILAERDAEWRKTRDAIVAECAEVRADLRTRAERAERERDEQKAEARAARLRVDRLTQDVGDWKRESREAKDALRTAESALGEARDEVAGFEAMWEAREKAHDSALREAFKSGMVYGVNAGPDVTIGDMLDKVDAQYPATPSGEGQHTMYPTGAFAATPQPEPIEVEVEVQKAWGGSDEFWERTRFRIAMEDARRLLALAQTAPEGR